MRTYGSPLLASLLVLVVLLFAPSVALAQANAAKHARLAAQALDAGPAAPGACSFGQATADLDVNNVRARLFNTGNLFWNGQNNTYTVPKDGQANAIFVSSLWVGGLIDGEIRFAGNLYRPLAYWPGPLDQQGRPPADCAPFDRIFKISRADLDRYQQTGETTADLRDWPRHLGAPVEDGDGNPDNYNLAAGDRPLLYGDQTLWWVMNDAGGVKERPASPAIGLEVQVTAYAFAADNVLDKTTFYRYRILNKGREALEQAYLGLFVDADLGDATDDFIGSDTLRQMAFVYNADDFDDGFDGYGDRPPALGYVVLQGAPADTDGRDNDHDHDGLADEAGERHGLSVFLSWQGGATVQGNPFELSDFHHYLRGLWRDGSPITVGGTGFGGDVPTRYLFPGDPTTLAFWSEENTDGHGARNTPADRRFMLSTGPFDLAAGQEEEVVVAIVWSRHANRLLSVTKLRQDADHVRAFFNDETYVPPSLPAPPATPTPVSPLDEADAVVALPTFSWEPVGDSIYYRLHVAPRPSFDSLAVNQLAFAVPTATAPLKNGTTYYWRVRAENLGGESPWSATRRFTTGVTRQPPGSFTNFLTLANAAGPLDPPEGAAADFAGFPSLRPTERQQTGPGIWLLHTGDNGTRGSFDAFTARTTNANFEARKILPYDFEIRFTDEGSLAYDPFCTGRVFPVPFELWRIGSAAQDDPTVEMRMVPYLADSDFTSVVPTTGLPPFNLNTTASIQAAIDDPELGQAPCLTDIADHSVSTGNDDPATDWIYWTTPVDETPGQAGYLAWKTAAEALGGGDDGSFYNVLTREDALRRIVLVNWNGGDVDAGVYDQNMPEAGTIFRVVTSEPITLAFEARLSGLSVVPPAGTGATGQASLAGTTGALTLEGAFSNLHGDFVSAGLYPGEAGTQAALDAPLLLEADLDADRRGGTFSAARNRFVNRHLAEGGSWFLLIKTTTFPDGELRGQVLPAPNATPEAPRLVAPADGVVLPVAGEKSAVFEAAWHPSGDANANRVVYLWQLAADAGFERLVAEASTGAETRFRTSFRHLDSVLEAAGLAVGEGATFYHRAVASDGSLAAPGQARAIRLERGVLTTIEDPDGLPTRFALRGNYPNPFNPATTLVFDLPAAADVRLEVFDVLGRRVLSLPEHSVAAGAARQFRLDASALASGLYFYRITAKATTTTWRESGRMVLVK